MRQMTGSIHTVFDRFANVSCVLLSKQRTSNAQLLCSKLFDYTIQLNELIIEFDLNTNTVYRKKYIFPKIQKIVYSYIKLLKVFNIVRKHELHIANLRKKEIRQSRLLTYYLLKLLDKVDNLINHN